MFDFIYVILGEVLRFIYKFVPNFGWSIVIFTVLVRVVLLPLMVKQQNSMTNMQKMQPELTELQKKYKNDKDKLNTETMKLYEKYKVNPMGGCLPMLIQMPILLAVYGVMQNPITYILKLAPSKEVLTALCQTTADTQLSVVAYVSNHMDKALADMQAAGVAFDLNSLKMNFDFWGLNLGYTPQANNGNYLLYLIPILSVLTSFLVNKVTQMQTPQPADGQKSAQNSQMQIMQYMFPFMSGYFCYILPSAMGLYWIVGNLLQVAQTYVMAAIAKKNNNNLDVQPVDTKKQIKENKPNKPNNTHSNKKKKKG